MIAPQTSHAGASPCIEALETSNACAAATAAATRDSAAVVDAVTPIAVADPPKPASTREWAAVKGPDGRGYYDGDSAGNMGTINAAKTRQALMLARQYNLQQRQ